LLKLNAIDLSWSFGRVGTVERFDL
jgi:hypothetical protein